MNDKYFKSMYKFIKEELYIQGICDILDEQEIFYFANKEMFIVNACRIIKKIRNYSIKNKKSKLDFYEFKKIIDTELK